MILQGVGFVRRAVHLGLLVVAASVGDRLVLFKAREAKRGTAQLKRLTETLPLANAQEAQLRTLCMEVHQEILQVAKFMKTNDNLLTLMNLSAMNSIQLTNNVRVLVF